MSAQKSGCCLPPAEPRPAAWPTAPRPPALAVPCPAPRCSPLARLGGAGLLPAALLGTALLAPAPAQAQRLSKVDGAALIRLCSDKQPGGCDAYVSGVADAIELMQRSAPEPHDSMRMVACIPPATTGPALRGVVVTYGQAHTGDQKLPAAMMVMAALKANFPCKAGQPS